jgi:hypothetical protein
MMARGCRRRRRPRSAAAVAAAPKQPHLVVDGRPFRAFVAIPKLARGARLNIEAMFERIIGFWGSGGAAMDRRGQRRRKALVGWEPSLLLQLLLCAPAEHAPESPNGIAFWAGTALLQGLT